MNFFKSYTFRIYPNKKDLKRINQYMAANRFVYNYILNLMINNSINKKKYDLKYYLQFLDVIIYENPWISICPKNILKINIFELFSMFEKNIFSNTNLSTAKYPKFKNRYNKINTFRINCVNDNIHLDLTNRKIIINNFLSLNIKGYRTLDSLSARIISVTFLCRFNKKYYVIVSTKSERNLIYNNSNYFKMVGIDIGIKHLLVTSDKKFYKNMHFGPKNQERLNLLKKKLCVKEKGSKNYIKAKMNLEREYFRLAQRRKHYIYEIVNEITDKYDIIFIENLNVRSMLQDSKISYMLMDASFYEIIQIFERKCLEKNKKLLKINRFFPSTQMCSNCGKINSEYSDLSRRIFKCKFCNFSEDRDYNASLNILNYGKKILEKNRKF